MRTTHHHSPPLTPQMWRDLNLRVGNRYSSNDSVTHMNVEVWTTIPTHSVHPQYPHNTHNIQVMEDSCPCSPSHLLQSVPDFLQWLTPRACGFTVLQLIMDIELPWENEVCMLLVGEAAYGAGHVDVHYTPSTS